MTRRELLTYGKSCLEAHHVLEANIDSWLLFQYVTELNRATYLMDSEAEAGFDEEVKYKQCIKIRAQHYPLQYITHSQEFMGLDFYVDEHVLVPRQDTEVLVETALGYLKDGMDILDMCTGSGCILISLAANKDLGSGVGVDLSEDALHVAQMNAMLNHTETLEFIQGDLYEGIERVYDMRKFDMIVSNPPYIPSAEILSLMPEVKDYEPKMALDGDVDGLYFYRKIIAKAEKHLKDNGMLFFEIGWNQAKDVSRLLLNAGFCDIQVKKDLAGLDRVVFAYMPEKLPG